MYQSGASMAFHVDKTRTHVVSAIVHIAHEYDDDGTPWPIEIEDHDGRLHIVSLEEGQTLLYEVS